jgi:hypothetical protein
LEGTELYDTCSLLMHSTIFNVDMWYLPVGQAGVLDGVLLTLGLTGIALKSRAAGSIMLKKRGIVASKKMVTESIALSR